MSFIGKRVINHRRIGLAIGLATALTTVGIATGGTASAAPAPPPIPKNKAVHKSAEPKNKVKSKTQKAPAISKNKALAGYQTVVSADVAINPGQARPASALCPAGTQVLGGGAFNTSAGGVLLTDTYPSGSGWYTWAYNKSGSGASFRAYAICGTGVDRYEIIRNGPHSISSGGQWESRSFCSAGDLKKIGGGESNSSATGSISLNRNFPDGHLNNWQVWINKSTPANETFSSHIICGNLPGFQYSAGPSVQIPEGGYVKATSSPCPAGTTVIGGAGASSSGVLTDSFPEGNAWTVYAKSGYPGTDTVTPLAVCAS